MIRPSRAFRAAQASTQLDKFTTMSAKLRNELDQLQDMTQLSQLLVDWFAAQQLARWSGQNELEEYYVSTRRNRLPYQKEVTLRLQSTEWTAMETLLDIQIADNHLVGFGRSFFGLCYQVDSPSISATFKPKVDSTERLTFIKAVRYTRACDQLLPFLWQGILEIDFCFPLGYFETRRKRGSLTVVRPLSP